MRARALLGAALLLACGGLPLYETPEERTAGTPLTQAPQRRTGEITWRPSVLETTSEGVRLELALMNGRSRDFHSVMLRLVLRGPEHEIATVRYPAGTLAAGAERRVRAVLAPPGFVVVGLDLELIYAQE